MTKVYLRDRSFYDSRPNNTPKRLHRESEAWPGTPACKPNGALLVTERPWTAEGNEDMLCRRCFPKGLDR